MPLKANNKLLAHPKMHIMEVFPKTYPLHQQDSFQLLLLQANHPASFLYIEEELPWLQMTIPLD